MDTKKINIALCKKFPKMKKWSGGLMIVALAMILVFSYSLIGTKPKNHLAYNFFHNHPLSESPEDTEFTMPSKIEVNKVTKPSKKPHLINVEGLDRLYGPHNISSEDSKALLVWAHMRSLLSRSDALPETAQGVKEASAAWKDLVSTIEEKTSMFSDINKPGDEYCPFSVDKVKTPALGDGMVLELPCGLIDDSSVSLVGIPDGPHNSFEIQLLGSQVSGQSKAPIVLHYNVSLPGDNMTEEPFIVQNTWTEELGWSTEERCPAHRSTNNLKGSKGGNEQPVGEVFEVEPRFGLGYAWQMQYQV